MLKSVLVLLLVMPLTSCAWLSQNVTDIGKSGLSVATAPAIQTAIASCVADDPVAQERLQGPAEFFSLGYRVITERGASVPILTLVEESPGYYEAVPVQWDAIWSALEGKNCGALVDQWRQNSEDGFRLVKSVVAKKDRLQGACTLYNSYAPIAAMFSPIPLPRRVPGCG